MPSFAYSQYAVVNLTAGANAVGLNPSTDKHESGCWANRAVITNGSNAVRLTFDGSVPTSTAGILLAANAQYIVEGEYNVARIQLIRVSSDSGVSISLEI